MLLLGLLQAGRDWSGAELCERLEVSGRTLRRDVDDLRGLGYGIESTRGVGAATGSVPVPPLPRSPCLRMKRSRSRSACEQQQPVR